MQSNEQTTTAPREHPFGAESIGAVCPGYELNLVTGPDDCEVWLDTDVQHADGIVIGVSDSARGALEDARDTLEHALDVVRGRLAAIAALLVLMLGSVTLAEAQCHTPGWVTYLGADGTVGCVPPDHPIATSAAPVTIVEDPTEQEPSYFEWEGGHNPFAGLPARDTGRRLSIGQCFQGPYPGYRIRVHMVFPTVAGPRLLVEWLEASGTKRAGELEGYPLNYDAAAWHAVPCEAR